MNKKRIIIVGGVAGGASAAARLRRLSEDMEIVLLERGEHVSFANCGLPYHIGGLIPDRKKLLLQTPQSLWSRFRIDVRVRHEATLINRSAKSVSIKKLETGETYELSYDKLVLSPGAFPIKPKLEGIEDSLILRNLADMDRIVERVQKDNATQHITVVGGGFIGLELAENIIHLGKKVSLVEAMPQVLAPLDLEMALIVQNELVAKGVDLRLGQGFTAIRNNGTQLVLADGSTVETDLVLMAVGVRPDVEIAKQAGLELGKSGGLAVNKFFQTSDLDIYGIGDAVEKTNLLGGQSLIPLAWAANRQGRLVADHIIGLETNFRPNLGVAIVKVFDLAVAVVGMNERQLTQAGVAYRIIHSHPFSNATYYPGAERMSLKLIFEANTGKILGAQGVGGKGVDKRIDVISVAMKLGANAQDLSDLELSYAPPYGSAKDPVNMLGYMAQNILSGSENIQWNEVTPEMVVVDVRDPDEYARGHISWAKNIPLGELRERLAEIDGKDLVVTCQVGQRGYFAARVLEQHGYIVKNLDGGMSTFLVTRPQDVVK